MYNLDDLPAVRAQLARDVAAIQQEPAPVDGAGPGARATPAAPVEYARAPAASGPQPTGGRPPAIQRSNR